MRIILLIILLIFSGIIDLRGTILSLSLLIISYLTFRIILKDNDNSFKVYINQYYVLWAFVILCQFYMNANGFQYLHALDTIEVFLPNLKEYLNSSDTLTGTIQNIWQGYDFFNRLQVGYYSYLAFWGYIANCFEINFYYALQLGNVFTMSLISVLINKVLYLNRVPKDTLSAYSFVICTCSIIFFYSPIVLRDGLIALIYMYIVYLFQKDYSLQNLVKMMLAIYICTTLRLETGLFAMIFLPIYMLINKVYKINILYRVLFPLFIILAIVAFISIYNDLINVFDNNYDYYSADVESGSGIIGTLQKIPIIGDVLSIIYTWLMPIPCWAKLSTYIYRVNLPEVYNIMAFPTIISAFFNLYVLVTFVVILLKTNITHFFNRSNNNLLYMLIPTAIFLLLQSAVVEQRRLIGMYCVIYCIWAVLHSRIIPNIKKRIMLTSICLFAAIQACGIILIYL